MIELITKNNYTMPIHSRKGIVKKIGMLKAYSEYFEWEKYFYMKFSFSDYLRERIYFNDLPYVIFNFIFIFGFFFNIFIFLFCVTFSFCFFTFIFGIKEYMNKLINDR